MLFYYIFEGGGCIRAALGFEQYRGLFHSHGVELPEGYLQPLAGAERLPGAHMVGAGATEMLAEPTLAKALGVTAHRLARIIHAHPTMNEGVMEAAEAAIGAAIHL